MALSNSELLSLKIAAQIIQVIASVNDEYPSIMREYEVSINEALNSESSNNFDRDVPMPDIKEVKDTKDAIKFLLNYIDEEDIELLGVAGLVRDIESKGYDTNPSKLIEYVWYWLGLDEIDEFFEEDINGQSATKLIKSKVKIIPTNKIDDEFILNLL